MVEEAEFQPGQRVRVREAGGGTSPPEQRWLGKEGTIRYGTGTPLEGGPATIYFVEFDSGDVEPVTPDWLEVQVDDRGGIA